jgi:hypothetical protein
MGPKPQTPQSGDLFRFPLSEHLNSKHELVLLGDALHAVLCGADHNIRLLLKKLRLLFTFIVWAISGGRQMSRGADQLAVG